MRFEEAVQALLDGICKKIRCGLVDLYLNNDKILLTDSNLGICLYANKFVSDKWELVGEILNYEGKEITSYVAYNNGNPIEINSDRNLLVGKYTNNKKIVIVEVKANIDVPIKPKVKKRIFIGDADTALSNGAYSGLSNDAYSGCHLKYDNIPRDLKIYGEWEE